ncbi:MAG: HEAT repeat domain-containing protein [Cyanobacteria bacterium P01_G01_bin.54]
MSELLALWGVGKATWSVFRPILEDLAKDVAKDTATSYVGQCFEKLFSVIYREPLTRATGQALKELLELIDNELIRAEIEDDERREWIPDVRRFIKQPAVRGAIAPLFLEPDYFFDPKTLVTAWQQLDNAHPLPKGFSWPFIAKRFTAKVTEIRQSSQELQETFESLAQAQDSAALKELAGLPPDFDLEIYREALVERYGTLDFASLQATGAYYSAVKLWNVFVPQSVRECHEYEPQLLEVPKDQLLRLVEAGELDAAQLAASEKRHDERRRAYINQPSRPILDVIADATPQRFVVLGDPGSGKSSLMRFLALQWARLSDANQRYSQPLPLLIELRDYSRWQCPSGKGFLQYLHAAPTWHRLNQQTLQHLLGQPNRVMLMLDGLDEVFDPVERERVVNDIHRFSNTYKQVRIVVTSRVVGYQPHRLRNAEFRHFMLQDLAQEQISQFLDLWHAVTFETAQTQEAQTKRERLDRAIQNSKSIRQLAGNPLLLTMMAILNRHQELPRDRVDLYQQCSRLLLHQWDTERALGAFPGLSAEIGLREKTDILRLVAYAMQTRVSDEARANYIDGPTLTGLIEDYLVTELRFDQARGVARALVQQLRERNFILCFLGADSYAFVHRTFLEYFCAAEIVYRFNARKLSEDGLIDLFDEHCRDDDWREVLRLVCGQIDEQLVGRIIEHLSKQTDLEQWNGYSILPELLFAIGCLSEVRVAARLDEVGELLWQKILDVFANGRASSDHKEILDAVKEVGLRWPGKLQPLKPIKWKALHMTAQSTWPRVFAAIRGDREYITILSNDALWAIRSGALQALTETWPDETTRQLLSQRAIEDKHEVSRSTALELLSKTWPDETTHQLLTQRAVEDEHFYTRSIALELLTEEWPDETTHQFLTQRAVEDEDESPRSTALGMLTERWPDETTHQFLTQRAVEDEDANLRSTALELLNEHWFDETAFQLLMHCAVEDEDVNLRNTALELLTEYWFDETIIELLMQCAVEDECANLRSIAIELLTGKWPDETTHQFLTQRAVEDKNTEPRGTAWAALGQIHSLFGCILPTLYLDGFEPYLDPLEPVPRDHIEKAAAKAGIPPEDIDAQVASLSAHCGWDITIGARPS